MRAALYGSPLCLKTPAMQGAILECTRLRGNRVIRGLRTSKMQGASGVLEARIDGGNRLTFEWDGEILVLLNHCSHAIVMSPRG